MCPWYVCFLSPAHIVRPTAFPPRVGSRERARGSGPVPACEVTAGLSPPSAPPCCVCAPEPHRVLHLAGSISTPPRPAPARTRPLTPAPLTLHGSAPAPPAGRVRAPH